MSAGQEPFAYQAAKASWAAPLIGAFAASVVVSRPAGIANWLLLVVFALVLPVVGIGLGVYALVSSRRLGRAGLLAPGLTGLLLSLAFFLLMVVPALVSFSEKSQ